MEAQIHEATGFYIISRFYCTYQILVNMTMNWEKQVEEYNPFYNYLNATVVADSSIYSELRESVNKIFIVENYMK